MDDPVAAGAYRDIPRIAASAGALILDESRRLLVLKPNYKQGWTIPGGQVDADGESPWDACRRETLEECGLEVAHGRLVCGDFLAPRPQRLDAAHRPGEVRFLFDCGTFSDERLKMSALQTEEIDEYRLAEMDVALTLLSGPLRRRCRRRQARSGAFTWRTVTGCGASGVSTTPAGNQFVAGVKAIAIDHPRQM